jgi:4-hydroxy-4-methyl-2-oxoglutarate aldolase
MRHTPDEIAALRAIDSPTVSNAIERFEVRPRCAGFAGHGLRCVFPELGPSVGYAVTCTADSTTEDRQDANGLIRLWEALEAAPKPSVLVIKDIGPDPSRSCHMGEIMATTAKALGAVGCVTDGGLRDVLEVRALGGFQYFCPGFVVSHGRPVICDIGVDVSIFGLPIAPADLLHGDINGLLVVPDVPVDALLREVDNVRTAERALIDFVRQPGFTVAKLRVRQRFSH